MKYIPYVTTAWLLVILSLGCMAYFGIFYFKQHRVGDLFDIGLLAFVCILLIMHLRKKGNRK